MQAPNVVVAHVVVFGQNQLHTISLGRHLTTQAIHHVSKPARLNDWGTFRGNLHDVHGETLVFTKVYFGLNLFNQEAFSQARGLWTDCDRPRWVKGNNF
jgi:hypothetical protein